jgi:hypothetical protein
MNLFSWLKRSPGSQWFSVIAEVKGNDVKHDLCEGPYLRVEDGELVLFANDASGFYFNNSGSILANIYRSK